MNFNEIAQSAHSKFHRKQVFGSRLVDVFILPQYLIINGSNSRLLGRQSEGNFSVSREILWTRDRDQQVLALCQVQS